MKATKSWLGALASALILVSSASAQYSPITGQYHAPVSRFPLGYAPNTYNPGFYVYCPDGQTLGPNYYLRPCFEPFQGVLPKVYCLSDGKFAVTPQIQQQQKPAEAQFPYHPYARGPRDFFMFRENMDEQLSRQARPNLLP